MGDKGWVKAEALPSKLEKGNRRVKVSFTLNGKPYFQEVVWDMQSPLDINLGSAEVKAGCLGQCAGVCTAGCTNHCSSACSSGCSGSCSGCSGPDH